MNIIQKKLNIAFFLAAILTLLIPIFFPFLIINFFASFMILVIYQKTQEIALYYALGCGLFIDMIQTNTRLGFMSLALIITTAIIWQLRQFFFADKLTTLPLMTFLFASVSTFTTFVLSCFLEKTLSSNWSWIFSDLIALPLVDALAAFSLFILPDLLMGKKILKGSDYFNP